MQVVFECVEQGRRLFKVMHPDTVTALFTGTIEQCSRFEVVYAEKVEHHAREQALRTAQTKDQRERRNLEENFYSRKSPYRVHVKVRG